MKNHLTTPLEDSYSKTVRTVAPAGTCKAVPGLRKTVKRERGKTIDPEDFTETRESTGEGAFQAYLNRIGGSSLLSLEQEVGLGRRIRVGFDHLLKHLLSSCRVGEILLEQTRAEIIRSQCEPSRRSALGGALTLAEAALHRARERFVTGRLKTARLSAEVVAAFGNLAALLVIRPDRCLEILAQLEHEFSEVFAGGATLPEASLQREFECTNLMTPGTFRSFLAEAGRLRAAVVEARNEMVAANLRLVVAMARKMKHAYLSIEDLVQEGNRGLVIAAERFDERLGYRFSTFATRLIQSTMRRENDNQGRTVRLPVHRCEALRKLEDARVRIEGCTHQPASVEALSKEAGISCAEVRELGALKQAMVSLDRDAGAEGEQRLGEFLPDPASLTPFPSEQEVAGSLDPYLECLPDAQRSVVAYVYGIRGCPQLTLKEAAERLGLQHSEARRLHQAALGALRSIIPDQTGSLGYARAA